MSLDSYTPTINLSHSLIALFYSILFYSISHHNQTPLDCVPRHGDHEQLDKTRQMLRAAMNEVGRREKAKEDERAAWRARLLAKRAAIDAEPSPQGSGSNLRQGSGSTPGHMRSQSFNAIGGLSKSAMEASYHAAIGVMAITKDFVTMVDRDPTLSPTKLSSASKVASSSMSNSSVNRSGSSGRRNDAKAALNDIDRDDDDDRDTQL
jgi:hypothetical protein